MEETLALPDKDLMAAIAATRFGLGAMPGELDAAHALYGLVYGTQLGIGASRRDMAILMNLNRNGQAITLSRRLYEQGARDGASLAQLMRGQERRFTFAQTFPTGTHATQRRFRRVRPVVRKS